SPPGRNSMNRSLARIADIAYRRRGRMVLGWILATIVLIGLGSSLAGDYHADYNTPGSESKQASDLTQRAFKGYSGQEIYVVWKDPNGAKSAGATQAMDKFFAAAEAVPHVGEHGEIRVSEDGRIATTTLPLNVPGWEVKKEQGEELIDAAETAAGGGLQVEL